MKAANSVVAILISGLKTLKSWKDFAFILEDLHFRAFIPVIIKCNKKLPAPLATGRD